MVVKGCVGVAVNANQLGSDALPHLRMVLRLGQNDKSGVGVHVDKARRNDMLRGVDGARRFDPAQVAAKDTHRIALDADRSVEARVAGAVYDESVNNQQVQHHVTSLRAVNRKVFHSA